MASSSTAAAFYAVRKGRDGSSGRVYLSWSECEKYTKGFPGAQYKKFKNMDAALAYLSFESSSSSGGSSGVGNNGNDVDDDILDIFTDGSCFDNGSQSSVPSGGIGVFFGDEDARNVSEPLSEAIVPHTNQYAELYAIARALEICLTFSPMLLLRYRLIFIHTDSMYAINCLTKWFSVWERNGYRLASSGKPVKHASLIRAIRQQIDSLGGDSRVIFKHERGHTGVYENEQADRLARIGSEAAAAARKCVV